MIPACKKNSLPDQPPHSGGLPRTVEWRGGQDGYLRLLDQTVLPVNVEFRDCRTAEDVWEAIRVLRVRGAPAIGVAAAYGLCLGTRPARELPASAFQQKIREVGAFLQACRPTAVNLAWAVQRVQDVGAAHAEQPPAACWDAMLAEAHAIAREDAETCRLIGEAGADLIPDGGRVLTHCNAGALATAGCGTALALLYAAHRRGRRFEVFADETRPLLQGARLTAFELHAAGINVTVICDSVAASLMRAGHVDLVVVGADRIAANGDVANKVGTYSLAVAAAHHRIPFYVAAPRSTFDPRLAAGAEIPIEGRDEAEVASFHGHAVIAAGVRCLNPAFDVTPADLITGIVTEAGLLKPVTTEAVRDFFESRG